MMRKTLQILSGLLLILVLAYLSFLEVSSKIKDDLLSKTKTKLVEEGIVGIHSELEGEGLGLTRTVILTGEVNSEEDKLRAASLVSELRGVCHVDNQIKVEIKVEKTPELIEVPVIETSTPILNLEENSKDFMETKRGSIKTKEPVIEKFKEPEEKAVTSSIIKIKIPVVPVVNEKLTEVPVPINVTTVPVAVEPEKALMSKDKKNVKTEGVE